MVMNVDSGKQFQIDDWCFEIKMVRALKVDKYGQPYTAVANCTINGDALYIDGLLTKENEDFSSEDALTFIKLAKRLNISKIYYHRYHHGIAQTKEIHIPTASVDQFGNEKQNKIKLIK
jgi:hypothetical protein